jgi:hypothetical protein
VKLESRRFEGKYTVLTDRVYGTPEVVVEEAQQTLIRVQARRLSLAARVSQHDVLFRILLRQTQNRVCVVGYDVATIVAGTRSVIGANVLLPIECNLTVVYKYSVVRLAVS